MVVKKGVMARKGEVIRVEGHGGGKEGCGSPAEEHADKAPEPIFARNFYFFTHINISLTFYLLQKYDFFLHTFSTTSVTFNLFQKQQLFSSQSSTKRPTIICNFQYAPL